MAACEQGVRVRKSYPPAVAVVSRLTRWQQGSLAPWHTCRVSNSKRLWHATITIPRIPSSIRSPFHNPTCLCLVCTQAALAATYLIAWLGKLLGSITKRQVVGPQPLFVLEPRPLLSIVSRLPSARETEPCWCILSLSMDHTMHLSGPRAHSLRLRSLISPTRFTLRTYVCM